jgi:hypothetical protein
MNDETLRKLQELLAGLQERAQKDHLTAERSPDFYDGRASGYGHAARLLKEILSSESESPPIKEDQSSA